MLFGVWRLGELKRFRFRISVIMGMGMGMEIGLRYVLVLV